MRSSSRILAILFAALPASAGVAAEVRVLEVAGEVELSPGGDDSRAFALRGGETVSESDRIVTGMESQARLQFADSSTVVVGELTDMKVALFHDEGGAIETRLWLRGGEISTSVNRSVDRPSDFQVKTPTATAGVRGTRKRVFTALDRTRISILTGSGYGIDTFGGTRWIDAGETSETNEMDGLETPDRVRSEDFRTDGASSRTPAENEAFQESSLQDVISPGLNNTGGVSPLHEDVASLTRPDGTAFLPGVTTASTIGGPGSGGGAGGDGGGSVGVNTLNGSSFDDPTAWSVGGSGGIRNGVAEGSVNPGQFFSVSQAFTFPGAGTYALAVDVDMAPVGGSAGVDLFFQLGSPGATFSGGAPFVTMNFGPGSQVSQTFTESITATGPLDNVLEVGVSSPQGAGASASVRFDNVTLVGPN